MTHLFKSLVAGVALTAASASASALTLEYNLNDAGLPDATYATVELENLENGNISVSWSLTSEAYEILGAGVGMHAIGFNYADDIDFRTQIANQITNYTTDEWTLNPWITSNFGDFGSVDMAINPNRYDSSVTQYLQEYSFEFIANGVTIDDFTVDNGWVAAIGGFVISTITLGNFDYNGITEANVAVAQTPVPAAVWLFGTGLAGVIASSRKRKAA